jgi:hypothetical protein
MRRHVQDHEHRGGDVGGHRMEKPLQGLHAACGSAQANDRQTVFA